MTTTADEADRLVEGITLALHDGEIEAVGVMLRLLAVRDPERAQDVVDTMRLGVELRQRDGDR